MTINEVCELLKSHDNFLVITHKSPDGDTVGSGSALCYCLNKIGKTAYLYNNPQFGDAYPWISDEFVAPEGYKFDTIVSVDLADVQLFPKGFDMDVFLSIDHHPSNSNYAQNTFVMGKKASCGEIICLIAEELMGELDAKIANILYVAVSTDTGCFCYANTKEDTFLTAAKLCAAGAENGKLNKLLFRSSTPARLALEGEIFAGMKYYHDNTTVIATLTLAMIEKTGVTDQEVGDIAALPGRVAGSKISAVIKEKEDNICKVSLRTNGEVNASEVCQKFGGGGHAMAAGCVIKGSYEEATALLINAIEEAK